MEALIGLGILFLIFIFFIPIVISINANINIKRIRAKYDELMRSLKVLSEKVSLLEEKLGIKAPTPKVEVKPEPEEIPIPAPVPTQPSEPIVEEEIPSQPSEEKIKFRAAVPIEPTSEPAEPPQKTDWSTFEEKIGKRWITWVGVIVIFFSVGFLIKYAFDNEWLGPTGRVVLGLLVGMALLIGGDRYCRRQWPALGQALLGGGLAVLYLSLFAAFSFYNLFSKEVVFGAMILVTVGGVTLSLLHNAIAINYLAILGGFLTPIMVSTGVDARDVLFAYLVILDLGVIGVAFFKRWRAVDFLAFVGTWVLFDGWYSKFYSSEAMVPTLLWLGVFYLIFLIIPFAYHLRLRKMVTVERFILLLANVVISFSFAYVILKSDFSVTLGFVALGMCATCLIMGSFVRRLIPTDKTALFGLLALAIALLTMAIPLQLKAHGISLAWAIEAPVLLFLGYRFRYQMVRVAGFLVLILVFGRLFVSHWPLHQMLFIPIINKAFIGAMFAPIAAAVFALIHHKYRKESSELDRVLKITSGLAAGFFGLLILASEIGSWLSYSQRKLASQCAKTVIWALGSIGFLGVGIKLRSFVVRIMALLTLLIAIIHSSWLYGFLPKYFLGETYPTYKLFLNIHFLAILITAASIFLYAYFTHQHKNCRVGEKPFAKFFFFIVGLYLLIFLSVEVYIWVYWRASDYLTAKWKSQMSISIVWGLYAILLLVIGFWKRIRSIRLIALGLFGVTALKLIFVDMSAVKQIYRIASFFILGILMIGTSYIYHRVEKRLVPKQGEKNE